MDNDQNGKPIVGVDPGRRGKGASIWAHWRNVILRILQLAALGAGMAGCASQPSSDHSATRAIPANLRCTASVYDDPPEWFDVRDHVLFVDSQGSFDGDPIAGVPDGDPEFRSYFEGMLRAIQEWRRRPGIAPPPNKLLIFASGGVRSAAFNLERARQQAPCMMRAGYFPIFLIMQAEVLDSYWEQASTIRGGEQVGGFSVTTPFKVIADIGEGVLRVPEVLIDQFQRWFNASMENANIDTAGAGTRLHVRHGGSPDVAYAATDKELLSFGAAPLKLLTSPFVYSIGDTAWTNMIRRARTAIRRPREFLAAARDAQLLRRYPQGTGAFSIFFAELQHCIANDGECWNSDAAGALAGTEITLIGASLGTIALNDLISLYPRLPYRDIVYMAAACSIRDFLDTVSPLLATRPDLRFFNLSLHPKAEAGETYGFGTAPTGSLLEWIDAMYADAPSMLDRTLGKWRNVAAAEAAFPEATLDRMTFTVFGFRPANSALGDPGDPQGHLDFAMTHMYYWLPDFWGAPNGPAITATN